MENMETIDVTIDPITETVDVNLPEQNETETTGGLPWKAIGIGTAAAGIGVGIIAKKFGPGLRHKFYAHKAAHLDKKAERIEKQRLATQVKLNDLSTPEPEATKEA